MPHARRDARSVRSGWGWHDGRSAGCDRRRGRGGRRLCRHGAARLRLDDPQYRQNGQRIPERVDAFLHASPFAHVADTPHSLALAVGLPPTELVATVERWNAIVHQGGTADPDFGRPLQGLEPIACPPFFAVQFFPMARKNFGGVHTDLDCRVLRPNGDVLPGLYAAGEVAGMAGGHINGRGGLEGTMLGPSLFSGRVAGRAAAMDLGKVVRPLSGEA